jgi:hypothetical protein
MATLAVASLGIRYGGGCRDGAALGVLFGPLAVPLLLPAGLITAYTLIVSVSPTANPQWLVRAGGWLAENQATVAATAVTGTCLAVLAWHAPRRMLTTVSAMALLAAVWTVPLTIVEAMSAGSAEPTSARQVDAALTGLVVGALVLRRWLPGRFTNSALLLRLLLIPVLLTLDWSALLPAVANIEWWAWLFVLGTAAPLLYSAAPVAADPRRQTREVLLTVGIQLIVLAVFYLAVQGLYSSVEILNATSTQTLQWALVPVTGLLCLHPTKSDSAPTSVRSPRPAWWRRVTRPRPALP